MASLRNKYCILFASAFMLQKTGKSPPFLNKWNSLSLIIFLHLIWLLLSFSVSSSSSLSFALLVCPFFLSNNFFLHILLSREDYKRKLSLFKLRLIYKWKLYILISLHISDFQEFVLSIVDLSLSSLSFSKLYIWNAHIIVKWKLNFRHMLMFPDLFFFFTKLSL